MSAGASGPAARRTRHGHASKVDRDAATKHTTVEFVAKEADEQVVTGVVMVPNAVDRQGDYETPATIESFAEQFEALYENGDADGGVMHAAWPSDWMDLEANGIAGKTFPPEAPIPDDIDTMSECIDWAESEAEVDDPAAFCQSYNVEEQIESGMWVQTWRVNDAGLWQLIEDDIIGGFSIGARDVSWRGPMEQAELPDGVSVPEEYPDDEPVYELEDGIIREVSAVDTPAVPDALILAKDDADKALDQYLGDREGFMAEAQQRGHSESEAEQLWDVLSRAAEVEGSDSPGKESLYERIGRAAAKSIPGLSAPDADTAEPDDAAGAEAKTQPDTAKEGRTLSQANEQAAMAAIDANIELLEDAGVDHGLTRFTDRDDAAFDLAEYAPRAFGGEDDGTDDEPDDDDDDDDTETESMTDTNDDDANKSGDGDGGSDPFDDAPPWAKSLKDSVDENSKQIEQVAGDDDGDDGEKDAFEDAPPWAKALAEQVEANAEAVESIGKQAGFSQQVQSGGDGDGEADKNDDSLAGVLRQAGVQ